MTALPSSRVTIPLMAATFSAALGFYYYSAYKRCESSPPTLLTYRLRVKLWALFHHLADSLLPIDLKLRALSNSHRASSTLYAAAKLDVFEAFREGPHTAEEAAAKLSCPVHHESLSRILRFLASQGLFTLDPRSNHFGLTDVGALLLRGPRSQLARVLANNDPRDAGRIGHNHIEDSIRRGGCAFQHASGKTCWQYYDEEPGLSQRFEEMMEVVSRDEDATMATDYPGWSRARSVVDVAGGPGVLLSGVVKKHPHLHGHATVLERPAVVHALDLAAAEKQGVKFLPGDFFEDIVPKIADVYILRQILHDWHDEDCVRILRNIHAAMHAGSRLLIIDTVIFGPKDPLFAFKADSDIDMMIWTGGKERSREEFSSILSQAGFKLLRIVQLRSLKSIVEAVQVHEGPAWHETISQGVRLSRIDPMVSR